MGKSWAFCQATGGRTRGNTNGDSDSIACIGGSISGAYLGVDAIPEDWITRIEKSQYLDDLATRLAEKKEENQDQGGSLFC